MNGKAIKPINSTIRIFRLKISFIILPKYKQSEHQDILETWIPRIKFQKTKERPQ